jgi:hypothetical protein
MNRKEIALKLSEALNAKLKYLGAPSFAYEVASETETFTIDRQGLIWNSKGDVVDIEMILNENQTEPSVRKSHLLKAKRLCLMDLRLNSPLAVIPEYPCRT